MTPDPSMELNDDTMECMNMQKCGPIRGSAA
jgi:hypothetical protein